MKNTKEKWEVIPSTVGLCLGWVQNSYDHHVINKNEDGITLIAEDCPTKEVANLIASAPELLTACKYALNVLESIPEEYAEQIADILDESIDTGMIENAINRAGGEK